MGSLAPISELHFVKGLDPVADFNNGTVYSDIIEVGGEGIAFLYYKGVSTGGTDNATITVQACDDVSASNSSAVVFWYKVVATTDTGWTAATTAGFSITGASCPLTAPDLPKIIASPTVPVIDMSVPASAAFISTTAHMALVVPVVGLLSQDALQACAWTMVVTSPKSIVTMQRPP